MTQSTGDWTQTHQHSCRSGQPSFPGRSGPPGTDQWRSRVCIRGDSACGRNGMTQACYDTPVSPRSCACPVGTHRHLSPKCHRNVLGLSSEYVKGHQCLYNVITMSQECHHRATAKFHQECHHSGHGVVCTYQHTGGTNCCTCSLHFLHTAGV